MKRFLTASAALALIALPPVLHATSSATKDAYEPPYVARYSLDFYKNDPVPLTATEIRRIEKAAALYKRTGKITVLKARVMPQSPAPVASAGSSSCVPAGSGSGVAPPAAQAPAAIVGPTAVELRRQAKADMLYKRTGIKTVLRASTPKASNNAAPVVATVAAAAGVPCAQPPVLAALSPSPTNPLTDTIQSGSLLGTPGAIGSVVQVVPEPGTLGLLGLGLLGLGLSRRKVARIRR